MNFKDLHIKPCYESGIDDIIEDFYVPVLGAAIQYDRIAGFFSSTSLAVAARGIADFIVNGGRMRLITSPRLDGEDIEIVKKIVANDPTLIPSDFGLDLNNLENEFEKNHVKALGWMLASGLLEMKLAVVFNDDGSICDNDTISVKGLFHQKVGILKDTEGNEMSVSGSINETASAWVNNDEEFKVFKEWTSAIKSNIVHYSSDFDRESISLKKYRAIRLKGFDFKIDKKLFFYQADALNKWKENDYRLLFEMATGTGKTRTAIAGIKYLNETRKRLITIITTPQNTLSKQWKDEVDGQNLSFDESVIVDGSVPRWDGLLVKLLLKNGAGMADHVCLYTTHNTASSDKFTNAIQQNLQTETDVLFVGDETHWLGARKFQQALLPCYKYRIGLSATPSRWFDDVGTAKLVAFYGNANFEFTIKDALTEYNPMTGKHFLVNYHYLISKVSLDEDETEQYKEVSAKISKYWNMKDNDPEAALTLERLMEKRANIIKNANAKYHQLEVILDELQAKGRIENMIIFVSPQQITEVLNILASKGIIFHKLTEKEGTRADRRFGNKSEREHIISKFKSKDYQVLVAIKCMDEGIDIPTADVGILMASSTNPREYIQRIGRIIRQSPNKLSADLYDICVDTINCVDDDYIALERKIRAKEQIRLREIAENAINSIDALTVINSLD